jgi:hypothetical protein
MDEDPRQPELDAAREKERLSSIEDDIQAARRETRETQDEGRPDAERAEVSDEPKFIDSGTTDPEHDDPTIAT